MKTESLSGNNELAKLNRFLEIERLKSYDKYKT